MIVDPPREDAPDLADLGRVHLLGAGGEGMARVSRLLVERGVPASGCDTGTPLGLAELRALGFEVARGNDPAHLEGVDTLVVSSAVRPTNVELAAARASGVRVLHRAAALASLVRGSRGVAVTGTHGKTTTSGMLAVALREAGLDPSYALGAELGAAGAGGAAHAGSGPVFVVEADESDGSFLWYRPEVAVVTNVDADHLENFGGSREAYAATFPPFVASVRAPSGTRPGALVACADDPGAAALVPQARDRGLRVTTYGRSGDADLRLEGLELRGGGSVADVRLGGKPLGRLELQVPGEYNALNGAAALAAGLHVDASADALLRGLAAFTGVSRRFELRGEAAGVRVYDDYAHHPVELAAVLDAARTVAGAGRVVVVFQPKRYSRTRDFAPEFSRALGRADVAVVGDVYGHLEDPIPGVDGELVASGVPLPPERVHYVPAWADTAGVVAELVRPGDLVLTVGGGDAVAELGPRLLALLDAGLRGGGR